MYGSESVDSVSGIMLRFPREGRRSSLCSFAFSSDPDLDRKLCVGEDGSEFIFAGIC